MNVFMIFGISFVALIGIALVLFNKRLKVPKIDKWLIFGVTFIFLMSASTIISLGLGQNKIAMGCLYGGLVFMYLIINTFGFFRHDDNRKTNVLGFIIATGGVIIISAISYYITTHPNIFIH